MTRTMEVSSQIIGQPLTGIWCSTCQRPSAIIADIALLAMPEGADVTQCDPVAKLATMHYCDVCETYFELPDVPVLIANRG